MISNNTPGLNPWFDLARRNEVFGTGKRVAEEPPTTFLSIGRLQKAPLALEAEDSS